MKKNIYPVLAFLVLLATTLACALPGGNQQPASSEDQVATVVAATLQALTPDPPGETPAASGLLPHSLYFLNNDNAGIAQVFRLETDGTTVRQVTSETVKVDEYDVSPMDGSVVYIVNNQLLLIQADGSGRRVLVDGGAVDENNPFLTKISSPVFSLDGGTIAFGQGGLKLYAVSTGVSNLVIENQWDDLGNGMLIPTELYWPERYSPDGSKLLITLGYYEGASAAVYYPAAGSLVRLTGVDHALICCDMTQWSSDGTRFHSANRSMGMFPAGLWAVDAASGTITTLLGSDYDTQTFNYADSPYLAPDGYLYYFFLSSNTEEMSRVPLQLVRSAPDGATDRSVLRPETFPLMNEALWAPDASFVIVANAPSESIYFGGLLELYYTDGSKNMVPLAPFGQQLTWGP